MTPEQIKGLHDLADAIDNSLSAWLPTSEQTHATYTAAEKASFVLRTLADQGERDAKDAARQSEWQPIETAPKDGTPIIAYRPTKPPHVEGMYWAGPGGEGGAWYWHYDGDGPTSTPPTHWMPLPTPPKEAP